MLATLVIVFRELIEAGLIIGIVMAATRGVQHRGRWVGYGVLAGLLGACLAAFFADAIGRAMEGVGQEMFNASVLLIAVVMLGWHNVWMARHGRTIAAEMKAVGADVVSGRRSLLALAIVVGVAVLREGSEVVLFLYGVLLSGGSNPGSMALGGFVGLAMGVAVAMLLYYGMLRIPARHLFSVTGGLITLLAAGMAAQAMLFLQQAGAINGFDRIVWDSSFILSEKSFLGQALHVLAGYIARPNELQLAAYVVTLVVITALMRAFKPVYRPRPSSSVAAA